jgi:hypothetical protein
MHTRFLGAFLVPLAAVVSGCVTMESLGEARRNASSGHMGCPPAEVALSDERGNNWTASCRGRVFYCTAVPELACKESIKP